MGNTNNAALDLIPLVNGRRGWNTEASKAFMQEVKDNLTKAGLPRTSTLNGGAITGYTNHYGSTGYSVSHNLPGWHEQEDKLPPFGEFLNFHVVVSGKAAGLEYVIESNWDDDDEDDNEYHKPVNRELLSPRIKKVFEDMGFEVLKVRSSGYQTLWDDDVEYNVITKVI